jgi:hypothetical protein
MQLARHRSGLKISVFHLDDRNDLGMVACRENFIRFQKITHGKRFFHRRDASVGQQRNRAAARDSRQKGAVRRGREHLTVLDDEDVGRRGFGDIAQHVEHERVVEAAHARLDNGAAIVGIETSRLGVGRHRLQGRPAKRRDRQRKAARRDHRRFVQAKAEPAGCRIGRHAHVAAMLGPVHRPDIDRRRAIELLQPFPGQADDLLGRLGGFQPQRDGGSVDTLGVEVEIGCDTLEAACAVEYRGCEPHGVAAGTDERDIALMPVTVDIGPGYALRGLCQCHRIVGSSFRRHGKYLWPPCVNCLRPRIIGAIVNA